MSTHTRILRFRTENSIYEIDLAGNRVRRLVGRSAPTPYQGPDGGWKTFVAVSPVAPGLPVTFTWPVPDGEVRVSNGGTVTSPVVSIDASGRPLVG